MSVPTVMHLCTFIFCISKNRHASAKSDFENSGEVSVIMLLTPRRQLCDVIRREFLPAQAFPEEQCWLHDTVCVSKLWTCVLCEERRATGSL
jgi:hypothetical protein